MASLRWRSAGDRRRAATSSLRNHDAMDAARGLLSHPPMASSDRAFRAFAREKPEAVLALLEIVRPGLVPPGAPVAPESVDESYMAPPPALDADWLARVGEDVTLHVELQGYRDRDFANRLARYHLAAMPRYPARKVHTVALWAIRPPRAQRLRSVELSGVRVHVSSIVLAEVPAERLLADARTACFAPGAACGSWSDDELCLQAARALRATGAGYREQLMAVALAATAGRYDAMVKAMKQVDLEPIVIEDLVRFGEDRGFERGMEKGVAQGLRQGVEKGQVALLLVQLRQRFGPLSPEADARVRAGTAADLERWAVHVLTAESVEEVLGDR